jgi:hypothetical protein
MIGFRAGRRALLTGAALASLATFALPAQADSPGVAAAVRVGTPGYGLELDLGLADRFGARLGYSFLDYNHTIDDTDLRYDGKLKISNASALLDWYVFGNAFHLTAGATNGGVKVNASGRPSGGTYELNGTTYTAAQVGSVGGRIEFGNSVAPYVGLGWGNPVSGARRLTFLFDVGVFYGGTPSVTLTATCGTASPQGTPLCTRLQQDVQAERHRLEDDVDLARWYPVVNLGLAYRF